MIKPIPGFGKLLDKKNSNQFLKPNTPRGPKISTIKFPLFSPSNNSEKDEQNFLELNEIPIILEQIIANLNPNSEINQEIISKLKNLIITICTLINGNKRITNKISENKSQLICITDPNPKPNEIKISDNVLNDTDESSTKSNISVICYTFKTVVEPKGVYEGQFRNMKKEGKGKMIFNDGRIYDGEWKNGLYHGKGIYTNCFDSKIEKYEGDFKNGKAEGKGIFYCANGDRYEGDIVKWDREGKGIYYYNNGDKYEGDFKNNSINGYGKYLYKNGNIYEGHFENAKANGYGISIYNYGPNKGNRYEGNHKNWNKDGKGIFYYNNGDIFEGEFKNDKKDGKGILYYKNGDWEIGNYIEDNKIGKHIKLLANGKISYLNY